MTQPSNRLQRKGRGTVSNATGRFERHAYEVFDDGRGSRYVLIEYTGRPTEAGTELPLWVLAFTVDVSACSGGGSGVVALARVAC